MAFFHHILPLVLSPLLLEPLDSLDRGLPLGGDRQKASCLGGDPDVSAGRTSLWAETSKFPLGQG